MAADFDVRQPLEAGARDHEHRIRVAGRHRVGLHGLDVRRGVVVLDPFGLEQRVEQLAQLVSGLT